MVLPVNDGSVNELMLDETVIILYNSSYTWIKIDHTDQRPDQYLGSWGTGMDTPEVMGLKIYI